MNVEDFFKDLQADVLRHAYLTQMPEEENEKTKLWIRAIAFVRKQNGDYGYAIVQRTPDFNTTYLYTNGESVAVSSIEKTYPFIVLDKRYIKTFKGNATEPRVAYLKSVNPDVDYSKMDFKELNKAIVGIAIAQQIEDLNNKNK